MKPRVGSAGPDISNFLKTSSAVAGRIRRGEARVLLIYLLEDFQGPRRDPGG